jgi:hypothetical protein
MLKEQFHMQIVDVAEILLIPVCVSYVTPDRFRSGVGGGGGGGNGDAQRADEDGNYGEDHEELGDEKVSAGSEDQEVLQLLCASALARCKCGQGGGLVCLPAI